MGRTSAVTPPAGRYGDARPAGRYGTTAGSSRRTVIALAASLMTVLIAYLIWVSIHQGTPDVRWSVQDTSFTDGTRAEITADFTLEPGHRAICTMTAANQNLTTVGLSDVTVGPSTSRTFRATIRVPTMEPATSATIRACVLA
ncbi:MAG TPA: DUF4307 domain-containing protein [Kineosporiaceae bacterium]|nr:DUF4307 domain-containing protein [Kineosporiaceae bacterium]